MKEKSTSGKKDEINNLNVPHVHYIMITKLIIPNKKTLLFSDIMDFNPWRVESIQKFSVLKCPECAFDSKEEGTFQDHAIENHPLSFILFGKPIKEECFEDPIIIEEHKLEREEDWNYTNESDILFMPSITVERSYNKLGGSENYSNEIQVEPDNVHKSTEIQLQKIEKELNKDVHEEGNQNCEIGKQYQDFRYQCSLCNTSYF